MAVDTCMTPKIQEEDDDDDEPIIFRRTKVTPKQNQVNSEIKKVSSQRHEGSSQRHEGSSQKNNGSSQRRDGSSQSSQRQDASSQRRDGSSQRQDGSSQTRDGSSQRQDSSSQRRNESSQKHCGPSERPSPGTASPNGQNSTLQKGKMVSSSKSAPLKSPLANPKASTSIPEKPKQPPTQNSRINNNDKKPLNKPPAKPNDDSEDSDDDKPLSARLLVSTSALQKSNSHNVAKVHSPHLPSSSKRSVEDSDDEGPLSATIKMKSGGEPSVKKEIEEKPSASKAKQNGSIKRPLGDSSTPTHSSAKKPKLSESSVAAKAKQVSVKAEVKTEDDDDDDDDDDVPIAERLKKAAVSAGTSQPKKKTITKVVTSSLKTSKKSKKIVKKSQYSKSIKLQPSSGDGQKWTTLEHNGVIFPPDYKPHGVKMLYNGQPVDLTPEQEEVATMFAVMKDTEYATKEKFVENFMNDWRGILGRNHIIKKFELCDFTPIYEWHQAEKEKKKQMTAEEKRVAKEEKLKQEEKYMWAVVDGVKEKVGNFRVEPPGLFRGRGEHPKMGKLKKRIRPSDITINIGKGVPIPECPIPGQRWKEVKHDNTVTWLAFWIDPINSKEFKYVFLAASSSLKGQSDKEKYEKARLLKDYIHDIRANYTKDFTNKDLGKRQIAVATYLIDKLALRAGNEKDDDEADTVGCCTLKVENVTLVPPNKLEFDFLGKDSIRYLNTVEVELPVYKAIGQFKTGKKDGEDLFDKLDTSKLNAHLKELMPGLTAKVFRTYNASITLDDQLQKNTKDGDVGVKVVVYNLANKEVAIICNHQRTESKSHTAQMEKLQGKIQELKKEVDELKEDLDRAKKGKPPVARYGPDGKKVERRNLAPDGIQRKINKTYERIEKMERDISTKEELKTIALGTSKINYLDPRISVAWCKRHDVPIEKIFNKSLLAKFAWAMDVDPSFRF